MPERAPRRSPEIEAVITRTLRATAEGDVEAISRLANPGPEFLAIGSDPEEWWGGDTFLPVMAAQMEEMKGMELDIAHIEGWEFGPVGWGAVRVRIVLGASDVEMRVTAVLVLDAGVWRIVQWHASEGVPNEESLGFSLTTTLTEILEEIDIERDLASLQGEGMLTLMFTDVEGSTAHARELGDRQYTQLMIDHISLVSSLAHRNGGQVVKTVGDGALLVFSSARAAVTCAVDIQRATESASVPYAVRIGVHAGDVVRTDSDVMGFAVNKAARVTSAAAGGQVVVSSVVRELVGSHPDCQFGGSFFAELKGIEGIHELVPVEWRIETPVTSRPGRTSL